MHLKSTLRNKRQVEAAWERANTAAEASVREAAVGWLATQIQIGRAGFDPYDETTLIIYAACEPVFAHRCASICGLILTRSQDGRRIAMILDAEARTELAIDDTNLPLMAGEPLASRAVDASLPQKLRIVDLDRAPEPQLRLVDDTPGMAALREARAAYERSVH
jgi:hypothetical protein